MLCKLQKYHLLSQMQFFFFFFFVLFFLFNENPTSVCIFLQSTMHLYTHIIKKSIFKNIVPSLNTKVEKKSTLVDNSMLYEFRLRLHITHRYQSVPCKNDCDKSKCMSCSFASLFRSLLNTFTLVKVCRICKTKNILLYRQNNLY